MVGVQILSRETVKPVSATPDHLRTFKLSMLDGIAPATYVHEILFFPFDGTQSATKSLQLKTSLAETLTLYFPLAGRIKEETSVDCSDLGVEFHEAQVTTQLSEFLGLPNMEELMLQLIACNYTTSKSGEPVLLAIQVNNFKCGAMAVGVSMSHLVGDMASMATFINDWASISRRAGDVPRPLFTAASLFPMREIPRFVPIVWENISTKRLVFSSSSIASLRAKRAAYSSTGTPTRVEAITALFWRCIVRATKKEEQNRALASVQSVNIRSRMHPPLPENSFGNLFLVTATSGILEKDYYEGCFEEQLRQAVKSVDADCIREVQGPNGHIKAWESMGTLTAKFQNIDFFSSTSWCRFPLYQADFGWGKPAWVGTAPIALRNSVYILDGKEGEGIEAWVNMDREDMARFEKDEELLSYVYSQSF